MAWLNHFSEFGEGIVPSASNERLPSVDGVSSDRHTGAATVSIPLVTPDGLGGLNPNLSLNYSTIVVDDVFAELGHDDGSKRIQANMAGYGWNLGGVNYITKNRDANANVYYTLILNGVSYDMYENPFRAGTYDTSPMSFAAITNTLTTSTSVWKIKTADGMTYEFGGPVPDLLWPANEPTRSLYIEMRTNRVDDIEDDRELEVVSWYLSHVEDTAGNSIDYTYEVERTDNTGCYADTYAGQPIEETEYMTHPWYNPVTRLKSVTWSRNRGKYGTATDAKLRINVEYSDDRTDFDHFNDPGGDDDFIIVDGCQPRKTRYRLEEIQVQAREYDSANWHLLRRYNLDFDYADEGTNNEKGEEELLRHLLLSKIHEYGADGGLFSTQIFTYTSHLDSEGDTENSIWLTAVDNGFGGKVTYDYKISEADCRTDHGQQCDGTSDLTRHLVEKELVEDGQDPPTYYVTGHAYAALPLTILYKGRARYLGVDHATTTIYTATPHLNLTVNYTTSLNQTRFEEYWFYQKVQGLNNVPDPRHGRLREMKIFDNSSQTKTYAHKMYTWSAHRRDSASSFVGATDVFSTSIWLRLDQQDEWVDGVGTRQTFEYDVAAQDGTQYGNITAVNEYAHTSPVYDIAVWSSHLVLQRRTETAYFPEDGWPTDANAPYLVSLPASVIVEDGNGACQAETRTIYASNLDPNSGIQNRDGAYNVAPATAYAIKTEQVISDCPHAATTDRETFTLLVTTYARDEYGNETARTSHNGTGNHITIETEYDTFYHLFPIERWNGADTNLVAKASYYGVDSSPLDVAPGYWGAMKETCAINDICTRFSYDQFGRKIRQWDRQPRLSTWPTDSTSHVLWGYSKPGELGTSHKTYIVTEWHAPRCDGNFVRRHYDGLGQLVVEQKSYQDYDFEVDGCGTSDEATGREIATFYQYDALGNQTIATVPQLFTHPYAYWQPTPNWNVRNQTTYDPLGRTVFTIAPNGEQTLTSYLGRVTSAIAIGRNGDPLYRSIRFLTRDELGFPKWLYNFNWTGSSWESKTVHTFDHNVLGKMTSVQYAYPSSPGTSTYSYDQAGRMTSMDDIDMGNWSYVYNRHNQLVQQKDARNASTCLYYDSHARMIGKRYLSSGSCPNSPTSYETHFVYGSSGIEAGKLTDVSVSMVGSPVHYTKTLEYNSSSLVITETIDYLNWPLQTLSYGYDAYGRTENIVYPDGGQVSYAYNGMGLHESIVSSSEGTIADEIGYDVLGRVGEARYPAGTGTDLYLTQSYYPWEDGNSNNANARLLAIQVGTEPNIGDKLLLAYRYNSFGNIVEMDERYNGINQVTHSFGYDGHSRLEEATYTAPIPLTHNYTFDTASRPQLFAGNSYTYTTSPVNGVSQVTLPTSQQLGFSYDANGNMTQRQFLDDAGVKRTQGLYWLHANELVQVRSSYPYTYSTFLYDERGIRTAQVDTANSVHTSTIYPSRFYELQWSQAEGYVPTRYYLLNDQIIALKKESEPVTYLHHDQVGSIVMTTQNSVITDTRQYYAYGAKRGGDDYSFDQNYTGQRLDSTGLMYYNARYYDPQLGMFISPDSVIPDPTDFFSYNRYLYGRGNPISNNDPTGHCPASSGEGNIICVAGFIPTETSTGIPGAVYFRGDNRDFSSSSERQQQRFFVWISTDTGEITDWYYHGTQRAEGPNGKPIGPLYPPRNTAHENFVGELFLGSNYLSSSRADDGTITFNYKAVCSDPICNNSLAAEGSLVFKPNEFGTYDTYGNVDAFPNLEAYHWIDGSLQNDYLFQMQNYTMAERESGHGNFATSLGMTNSIPFSANFVDANKVQMHTYQAPLVYVP